jgi:hypothetical protein
VSFDLEMFGEEYLVETAPRLTPVFEDDSAACYELNPDTGEMALYQPEVRLKRGLELRINKGKSQVVSGETFYPIKACSADPRAEELYINAAEVFDLPESGANLALRAKTDTPLFRICAVDEKGRPVFEETGAVLSAETKLRASALQKAGPGDRGDGIIHGKGRQAYYLVTDCPRQGSAAGLFVRKGDVRKISQRLFEHSAFEL